MAFEQVIHFVLQPFPGYTPRLGVVLYNALVADPDPFFHVLDIVPIIPYPGQGILDFFRPYVAAEMAEQALMADGLIVGFRERRRRPWHRGFDDSGERIKRRC